MTQGVFAKSASVVLRGGALGAGAIWAVDDSLKSKSYDFELARTSSYQRLFIDRSLYVDRYRYGFVLDLPALRVRWKLLIYPSV